MSSSSTASLQLLSPSPPAARHHRRRRRAGVLLAAATPSTAPAAPQPPTKGAPEGSRLEPRVAQRDGGYWVLKEKFRQGINPQEKVKLEKEPMSLFMEGGIRDLAATPLEDIEAAKLSKDDIDVRLKWLGLFHRRKHQYGRFMMRLKLPNGVTTSEQTRFLAGVIDAYGAEGCADVTTRQNWQIRGVRLPDVPEILDGLDRVGLNSLQSGMDNVRNPVGNPLAGFDPHEIVDTRPYTNLLSQFITGNGRGNPGVSNLLLFGSAFNCVLRNLYCSRLREHLYLRFSGVSTNSISSTNSVDNSKIFIHGFKKQFKRTEGLVPDGVNCFIVCCYRMDPHAFTFR